MERGEVKEYYSELTDIARTYIEEAIEIPAMESTTDELIAAFKIAVVKKKLSLTDETIKNLEKVLKQADLVKFAKLVLVFSSKLVDSSSLVHSSNLVEFAKLALSGTVNLYSLHPVKHYIQNRQYPVLWPLLFCFSCS